MKESRHVKAGRLMGESIIEAVHMMYQDGTAARYYRGLSAALNIEIKRRSLNTKVEKFKSTNTTKGKIKPCSHSECSSHDAEQADGSGCLSYDTYELEECWEYSA